MRILHITSHLNVGGITTYVVNVAKACVSRGHEVIVASGGGSLEPTLEEQGIAHWRVPLHTKTEFSFQVAWAGWQLDRKLREHRVDILHAHTRTAQVVAHWLSRRHRIPYVTTWHGFYRHRRLGRRWFPCTGDLTIAISSEVRGSLMQDGYVPEHRIRLIYHGIDVDHFAQAPSAADIQTYRMSWLSDQRPVIGCVGRLASGGVKGFDLLLGAAKLVQRDIPNLEVLIVGDGPRRAFLESEAARLGIRDRVHFVGAVHDVRIPMTLIDVFIFASRWPEAFGLSLIEAMAMGRPVVATRTGAVPEIIEHGRNGWLVPPDDAEALAEGVLRLLNDPAMAAQLGGAAQVRAREAFGLDRMIDAVEAVYGELTTKR